MDTDSVYTFAAHLQNLVHEHVLPEQTIVILCIGSDRATGDCLGPIIGYKITNSGQKSIPVYGTLSSPVHAKNLDETIQHIYKNHQNPFIIAIDASLGKERHIGYVTLGSGSLSPGIGVDKELPTIGDVFITGIVNVSGLLNHMLLQTTRLDVVMHLADYICVGLQYLVHTKSLKKQL